MDIFIKVITSNGVLIDYKIIYLRSVMVDLTYSIFRCVDFFFSVILCIKFSEALLSPWCLLLVYTDSHKVKQK